MSTKKENLSLQVGTALPHVAVLGEVLWDLFEHSRRLGGAPLNFGVHARRLGHPVTLISALGADEPGEQAAEMIAGLDLDTRFLQTTSRFPTGAAHVQIGPDGATQFTILRPAAYDAVDLSAHDLELLEQDARGWFYYGTLFTSTDPGKSVLHQILGALQGAKKFYDLNLRPGSDSPKLVCELLQSADVVKLNEEELQRVHEFSGLPLNVEAFCRQGSARFGWQAVGVTLGDRGCAVLAGGHYVEAAVHPIEIVDTVGAGDAFAAAFMHGLSLNWPAAEIASFANRVGALVASRHGAIPDWTLEEAVKLG
ncbi:MAG: carbohydrate kinase [Acidobacteriia bacterium]|nr:carbohydrate kinase [Terriglobia bacterium]